MNIYLGNVASMLLLNSKPPVFQKGRFSTPVVLKQGAVWKAMDPQAEAKLMNMDNGALEQFVPMAGYFASQIKNIMGRPNGGTPNVRGKTAPAAEAENQENDTAVNQITKILENFLRQYGLVALDTLLSEQEGEDDIIIDDETKESINQVAQNNFVPQPDPRDPTGQTMTQFVPPIGADNKMHIDWQRFYEAIEDWSVEVEVSLSQDQINSKKRADLQDMLVVLGQNAQMLGPQAVQKVDEIANMLLQDQVPLAGTMASASPTPAPAQLAQPLPPNPAVGPTQ
jgi:hypothetical protein